MRAILSAAILTLLAATNYALAQAVDEEIRGPARRAAGAAGDTLGVPGVENRIERREDRRDVRRDDADRWRMRYYNGEWWYYGPDNRWSYYRDSRWTPFDRAVYRPLVPRRYTSGYRGSTYTSRTDRYDRSAYGKAGPPSLTIHIHDGKFEPASITVPAGTTVHWVNRGADDHTVTADNETWDSGEVGPDGMYSARFRTPGTYQYHCDLHKNMVGTINVTEPTSTDIDIKPNVDVDVNRDGVNVEVPTRPDAVNPPATPSPGTPVIPAVPPARPGESLPSDQRPLQPGTSAAPRPIAPTPAPGTTAR